MIILSYPYLPQVCDLCHITLNKNAVYGDSSALAPGGVRIGTPAMTSRGLAEADFIQVAEYLHRAVQICIKVQSEHGNYRLYTCICIRKWFFFQIL